MCPLSVITAAGEDADKALDALGVVVASSGAGSGVNVDRREPYTKGGLDREAVGVEDP